MSDLERMHSELVSLIFRNKHSIRKPKRHGDWLKLSLWDGQFFEIDTWNNLVKIKKGGGAYCKHAGYAGADTVSFGGSFGGFFSKATKEQMQWGIDVAKAALADYSTLTTPFGDSLQTNDNAGRRNG